MQLICLQCETRYSVDESLLPATGRQVQCTVCGYSWRAETGPDKTTAAASLADSREAPQPDSHADAVGFRWARMLGILGLAGLVGVLLVIGRGPVSAVIPPLLPVYAGLGLKIGPDLSALSIEQLTARRMGESFRVSGMLRNSNRWPVHASWLDVKVTDAFGSALVSSQLRPDAMIIAAGGKIAFSTQLVLDETPDDNAVFEVIVTPLAGLASSSTPPLRSE